MNNILLLVPPHITFQSFVNPAFNERTVVKKSGKYGSLVTDMPIGLLSLSAYLKKHTAVEIKLIDFNIVLNKMEIFECRSFSELFYSFLSRKELIDYSPSIIGITALFTPSYHSMLDIGKCCREIFPRAVIVAGGGVPTNIYDEIFDSSTCFDALCYGEGEKPLLGLVEANDRKYFLKTHPSWITREKAEHKQSFEYDFINNLDEIPLLDYSLLDKNEYRINQIQTLFPQQEKMISMPYLSSRGCPHRCCFCSSHTVHGREMRYLSLIRIKEDFKYLREEYGARTIIFQDDHFLSRKERALSIIGILHGLKMNAFFPNSLALYALDRDILEALKNVGVNHLVLSVESGSNRVLKKIMHKPLDLSIVKRVIANCRELGIASDVSILIGLPGETKEDIEDTRSFLKTVNPSWFRISMATPLIGSEMLDICVKNNFLKDSCITCDFKKPIIETEEFTPEYIKQKAYEMNLELNFVKNNDFRMGNYDAALKGFENVIRVKNDHAFAIYLAAECCKRMKLEEKYLAYEKRWQQILQESAFWKSYASRFELRPLS